MKNQTVFQRTELKYLITCRQQRQLLQAMGERVTEDAYGHSTICNVYYDTPDSLLIRRSLEKPVYKEKLRVRSYGAATPDSNVYVELKKKFKSVVYKRRISTTCCRAEAFLATGTLPEDTQIAREIAYALTLYPAVRPAMMISYERDAFYDREDPNLRVTFDDNVLYRDHDLDLTAGVYGTRLLAPDQVLMEIKAGGALPLWLTALLTQQRVYKTSFSKYGTAYMQQSQNRNHMIILGGIQHAANIVSRAV